jgi:drug/metabolite transporter (DMT)-like permease
VLLGPRLSTLMMATVPIISVLLGWLLFGETVTGLELTGVLLTVTAVAWVVTEKQQGQTETGRRDFKRGVLLGFGGALGQVLNLVTARYGLTGNFSSISATIIRILVALIILWGIAIWRKQARKPVQLWKHKQAMRAIAAGSFVGPFLGIWLSLIAIQLTRLGIASTLMALPPVILIPIEYFVLKKPISGRGITGTLAAIAGVALIFVQP